MNQFLINNKNLLLIGTGIGMQLGGTLCAISATRASNKKCKEEEEKIGRALTKKEILAISIPYYIPTVLLQVGGGACVLTAANNYQNMFNSAILQAGTAYTALNNYKQKTAEVLGDKAKQKVDNAVAQQVVDEDTNKYSPLTVPTETTVALYKEPITRQEFLATWNEIEKAAILANKIGQKLWGAVSVNDFLNELIKQPHTKGLDVGDRSLDFIGWKNGQLIEPQPSSCQKGCYVIGMIEYVNEPSVISNKVYD